MADEGTFIFQASLEGMAAADCLSVELPLGFASGSVSQLLDRALSADEAEQREFAAFFDLRANPDLPDIYAVFLAVTGEWRDWRCALRVTSGGEDVDLEAPAARLVSSGSDGPLLSLRLEQQYSAIEYAVRHGFWDSRAGLLTWLRSLTALYFLDKHDVRLDASGPPPDAAPGLSTALNYLRGQDLIAPEDATDSATEPGDDEALAGEPPAYAITPEGRRFIGDLLAETESYIDQFDHLNGAIVDLEGEFVQFGTGRGLDLRVEAFLLEGLDPVRTVFLLRLYDGTLDSRLRDWTAVIGSEEFYDAVLEPVVNRDSVPLETMELIIESGYAWLEQMQEQARREEQQRDILRRAGGEAP